MLKRPIRRLATAGVVALVLLVTLPLAASAGPPDRTLSGVEVALDNNCVAAVTWQPLQGGRPMFAHVTLEYFDGEDFRPVLFAGANAFHKVKQNAGILELDFGSLAAAQGATDYRVEVNFVDAKDQAMSGLSWATSSCGAGD